MTEETAKEAHALRSEKGDLQRRMGQLQARVNQIDRRLLQIKWAEYPIGCRVTQDGETYEISGYESWNLRGWRVKKDGTLEKRTTRIAGEVRKI
jgi:hypothetical protein